MDDIQLIINIEELELWSVGKPEVKYNTRSTRRTNICPGPGMGGRGADTTI